MNPTDSDIYRRKLKLYHHSARNPKISYKFAVMQTTIPFHIAYLLTQHECVIVPGLGAFVVSPFNREKTSRWGILSPPENFLGFNSEIKHNDGLLANSVARATKRSFKEASLLIEQYVSDVLQRIDEGKKVDIPMAGSLYMEDNKKMFLPEKTLSCNAFNYGLSSFSLPYLKDVEQKSNTVTEKRNKEIVWVPVHRKFITYAGSIAAALLAMCIIPTPLNDGHFNPAHAQYASFINLSTQNEPIVNEETETVPETEIITPVDSAPDEPKVLCSELKPVKITEVHYYIIIASLPDQLSAKKTLSVFQSKGFENAAILSSDGRHRIYTNRFEDKAEAEKFLIQFRKNYPEQASAWLLKQKD